jgi:hypothetical protein
MLIPLDIIENEYVSRTGRERSESQFKIKGCIRMPSDMT